jgi:hypothetical protein
MDLIAMFAAGMYRPLDLLQIGRSYPIVRIMNRTHAFFMVLRISWESGEVLVQLPEACANRFSRGNNERINNRSLYLDLVFIGRTYSIEPILQIRGNGFAMII